MLASVASLAQCLAYISTEYMLAALISFAIFHLVIPMSHSLTAAEHVV